MHRLLRLRSVTALTAEHMREASLRVAAATVSSRSDPPPAHAPGSGRHFAKWSPDPLANPWGRSAGQVVQQRQPPQKQRKAEAKGKASKQGGKALKLGSKAWRQQMAAMKQGVTVSIQLLLETDSSALLCSVCTQCWSGIC